MSSETLQIVLEWILCLCTDLPARNGSVLQEENKHSISGPWCPAAGWILLVTKQISVPA